MNKTRNLDGVYFRVNRDGKWTNRCFTDLTDEERLSICEGKNAEWFKSLAFHLADVLREIADTFDIEMKYEESEETK